MSRLESVRILLPAFALATVLLLGPGAADAGIGVKTGKYKGKTTQAAVASSFRVIAFTVKKGRVTLTREPTVARELCVSTPVFTLDGNPRQKLGRNGTFTFTHTFVGTKVDKIHGRFVGPDQIEGSAIYHFSGQDLCTEGRAEVSFTAKHK
jgi:hypothetical protein